MNNGEEIVGLNPQPSEELSSVCPQCGKQCSSPLGVSIHLSNVHGIKGTRYQQRARPDGSGAFKCNICGFGFSNAHGLSVHRSVKHGIRVKKKNYYVPTGKGPLINCPDCGKPYSGKLGLAMHRAKVHGVKGETKSKRVVAKVGNEFRPTQEVDPAPELPHLPHCPECGTNLKPFHMAYRFVTGGKLNQK